MSFYWVNLCQIYVLEQFQGPRMLGYCKFEFFIIFRCLILAPKIEFLKQAQKAALRLSTCSYRLPVHPDIFLFEIGQKMAELWAKRVCPNMGACTKFSRFCCIMWVKMNIFQ